MWQSRSRIVGGLLGATALPSFQTFAWLYSGRCWEMGSSISSFPSSASIRAAADVMALVMEKIRKMVSSSMGFFFSISLKPKLFR